MCHDTWHCVTGCDVSQAMTRAQGSKAVESRHFAFSTLEGYPKLGLVLSYHVLIDSNIWHRYDVVWAGFQIKPECKEISWVTVMKEYRIPLLWKWSKFTFLAITGGKSENGFFGRQGSYWAYLWPMLWTNGFWYFSEAVSKFTGLFF